ncbi:hypothetical protein AAC691_06915 [Nguyenibacter vanlangensis]|uniref:Uncharacterized protein n=1 Tax=Nguyenibacter vanlangensis TaxID=1216886 RepID=A0ABZ3DBH7_9PROT
MTLCPWRLAADAIAKPKPEFAPVMKKVFGDMLGVLLLIARSY